MRVLIVFGSKSDTEKMKGAAKALSELGVEYEAHVLSAHRVPEKLEEVLCNFEKNGGEVVIAGAGLAAHLPGVVASKTTLPVIGVPLSAAVDGMDALFSIVQMPKGIPVSTVGIDNSYNAGLLAAQILATGDVQLKEKIQAARKKMKEDFTAENAQIVEFTF